jgi:Flp pilus assembly protein TadD
MEVAMAFLRSENSEQMRTLVSWKEIAVFLNHSESTVKRWERERGLPVHRIPGGERGGVYAYAAELDAWLHSAQAPETAQLIEPPGAGEDDLETAGNAQTDAARVEAASEAAVEPQPAATIGQSVRLGDARRIGLATIGMAAALAGAAIYANFAHPLAGWIQQRLPGLAGIGQPGSSRQLAVPVSDSEKSVAHSLYLKGRFEWNQRTPDTLNRALDDFTQSIVRNPNDALAYAGLADAYEMLFIYGSRQDDDARDRAMAAARKAVALDASLSEAHRALGYAMWRARNFAEAEKELNLAIQLDPQDPLAHMWLSNVLANQGKGVEGLAEINKAQELDPASTPILAAKGERLYWIGKKEEGITLLNEVVRSEPGLSTAHLNLAVIEYHERNYPAYLRESQAVAQIRNDAWLKDVTAKLSAAYARDGERGLLNAAFAVQESCSPPVYPIYMLTRSQRAFACMDADRRKEAIQLLEEASANHEKDFEDFRAEFISASPHDLRERFGKLADDPRVQALMKQNAELPKTAKLPTSSDSGSL